MSRYLPRELGYPFPWDEYAEPRRPARRIVPTVPAQQQQRRRPAPSPITDTEMLMRENRALKHELEAARAEAAELRAEIESAQDKAEPLREENQALRAELASHGDELDELTRLTKQHRLRAVDAENEIELAKDRIRRESAKELEQRRRSFVTELLEVMDDLDRALAAARSGNQDSALLDGVELVRKSFLAKLEAHAISHCPSEGSPFDPERHQAVSTSPVHDPALDGVVVAVAREGYLIGDETLRPANVVVGKYAANPTGC